MTQKRFTIWNNQKQKIDKKERFHTFKVRDILSIKIGENVGFEQSGKGDLFLRPVLVYKKFSDRLFLGIPLTSKPKKGRFYVDFPFDEKISVAILSQIRLFDAKRIHLVMGRLGRDTFSKLKKKLIEFLQ